MSKPANISIQKYSYDLPEERIAKYPLDKRDRSKLLVYQEGKISARSFREVNDLLQNGDQLFFNTTRVIQARLQFVKTTGANIEIFCLEPVNPSDYQLSFSSTASVSWKCLVGNAKKWKDGKLSARLEIRGAVLVFHAEKLERIDDKYLVRFSWDREGLSFAEILEEAGSTPIPPYLKRKAEKKDASTYQTVYAKYNGSVAAPTAGLHFTDEILDDLGNREIEQLQLTLHVGAGTFIPVKEENAVKHQMHAELVTVDRTMLRSLLRNASRRIAVGTTTVRSLESLYWLGIQTIENPNFSFENLKLDQWTAYEIDGNYSLEASISSLLQSMERHGLESFSFYTRIMITPGYQFKVIDGLFTNFHQPKSTLLLLIAAVVGDDWQKIYEFALKHEFRFLSYGDSSLLIRNKGSRQVQSQER